MPIKKADCKKAVQAYLWANHPELIPVFDSKIQRQLFAYLQGYTDCLEEQANAPVNQADFSAAIEEAGIRYVLKLLK